MTRIVIVFSCLLSFSVQAASLQEVVDTAIKTNPDVLAAIYQKQAVTKEVEQAQAGYYPTVDVAVGTGWEMTDNPSTRSSGQGEVHMNRDEASINVRQMLFDGMETKHEVERHNARSQSRSFTAYSTAENTGLEAVEAYLAVLRHQKLVELAQTNYEAHLRTHDQIQLRSTRGVGRKADMDQSLGRLALAQANLVAEESNLLDAETSYIRVVGIQAEDLTQPDTPLPLIPETVEEAIEVAINNHPTMKSAEYDLESAHAQHATAKAPYYPDVHLELGARADNDINGVDGMDKDITAMLRLRYNLLNGGRDTARREETAYLINEAAEIRNDTRRQVEEAVRLAWNAWRTLSNQLEYREIHVLSSEKSRDAYQLQFNLGQRTLLDLLDSENELFRARTALVETQYDELYALYRILNSMGMLLQGVEVEMPESVEMAASNE